MKLKTTNSLFSDWENETIIDKIDSFGIINVTFKNSDSLNAINLLDNS